MRRSVASAGAGLTQLTWFDPKRGHQSLVGEAADWSNPALSPDGRTLAACKRNPVSRTRDIWTFDLDRGTPTRLTFDAADDFNPLWSPDGRQIVFVSNRKGPRDLYRKDSSGAGAEELLLESDLQKSCEDWTRDGRFVIYNQVSRRGDREIWALPLLGDRKPFRVISGPGDPSEAHVSPDGKWMVMLSYDKSVEGHPPNKDVTLRIAPVSDDKPDVSKLAVLAKLFGGQGTINVPSWAPDSKNVAFVSYQLVPNAEGKTAQ